MARFIKCINQKVKGFNNMLFRGNLVLIIGSTEAKTQPKWYMRWQPREVLNGVENI